MATSGAPGRSSLRDLDLDLVTGRIASASPGELAILYCRLLWPTFEEVEGVVLLEGSVEDHDDRVRLVESLDRYGRKLEDVQKEWNFYEVSALFGGLAGVTDGDYDWFVAQLARMWKAGLGEQFPNRKFVVEVVGSGPSDGHDAGVVFYEPSDGRPGPNGGSVKG